MKHPRTLIGLLLLVTCGPPADPESRPGLTRVNEGWELVWADEFEGSELDGTSWTVEVMPDPHNEELQYYTDRVDDDAGANLWLENGLLVIEAFGLE